PASTTGSWNTTLDAPRANSGERTTSCPPSRAVPVVGTIVVVSIPTVVDLPAPFGPSSPNTSPVGTSKSIPLTASTPPGYVLRNALTSIAFMSVPPVDIRMGGSGPATRHIGPLQFVTQVTDPDER